MWVLLFATLFIGSADAADLRCARDHFRQLSTGKCVAKDSALGRRYYRHSRARAKRAPRRHRSAPAPIPAAVAPAMAPADPEPPASFPARFYYGKGDRLPAVNFKDR